MTTFREKLEKNIFTLTSEIGPPKGVNMDKVFAEMECLRERIDAFNVTDQQSAVMRLGSIAASKALIDKGYEPICQFTCRDRNRIGIQSDLLSAYSLGIKNILTMTGDRPGIGDHPDAKGVYDLDTAGLINAAMVLNSGFDLAGKELNGKPDLFIGSVLNPGADDVELEVKKLEGKVSAGAVFFQTQAVFEAEKFDRFLKAARHLRKKIKILAGIIPLKSVKAAEYMNKNIPGIFIPEDIIKSLDKARDKEEEAVNISSKVINEIKAMCDGIHFMPIGSNSFVESIAEKAGI